MEASGLKNASRITVVVIGLILLLIYAQTLLIPLVIGAYLAMLLVPMVNWLEKHRIPRGLSILAAILLCLVLLFGLGYFFGTQIASFTQDLTNIQERLNQLSDQLESWIASTFGVKNALNFKNINDQVITFIKNNASAISGVAFSTIGTLGLLILIPVYIFLFLLYRDHFTAFAIKLFKQLPAERVRNVTTDLRSVIQHYISGMLKVMVILATLNAIGLLVLGIKHAIFFAIFAAILNVVPYIGPLIGSIVPMTFALLTKDSLLYPLGVFIIFSINQSIEGNFLTPKIVGSNVSINPITSLLALFIGGMIWGVVGMIIFIPLSAIIKKLLELSPSTMEYAFLMGERESEKKKEKKKSFFQFLKKKKKTNLKKE